MWHQNFSRCSNKITYSISHILKSKTSLFFVSALFLAPSSSHHHYHCVLFYINEVLSGILCIFLKDTFSQHMQTWTCYLGSLSRMRKMVRKTQLCFRLTMLTVLKNQTQKLIFNSSIQSQEVSLQWNHKSAKPPSIAFFHWIASLVF